MFTVTNGGSFSISRKHQISCFTKLAVGNNGAAQVVGITSWVHAGQLYVGTPIHTPQNLADSILNPGGDAQTDPCLKFLNFAEGTDCVDITLTFWYALETQRDYEQEGKFRYVAYKDKRWLPFNWYGEPIDSKQNFCREYIKNK